MDRYLVISSDCHAGLPPEQYREYVDPQFRDAFDVALPIQIEATQEAAKKFLVDDINAEWRKGHEDGLTGAWDSDARLKVLDDYRPWTECHSLGGVPRVDGSSRFSASGENLPHDTTRCPGDPASETYSLDMPTHILS